MPGFGEKFSKFASDTKKNAQVLVETNKLNSDIHKVESAIGASYAQIGKCYFDTYQEDQSIPANFRQMLDEILDNLKKIDELKAKIVELRGEKICPGCGATVEAEKMFCGTCGYKFEDEAASPVQPDYTPNYENAAVANQQSFEQPEAQPTQGTWPPPAAESAPVQNEAIPRFCPNCGNPVSATSSFCSNCGQKM